MASQSSKAASVATPTAVVPTSVVHVRNLDRQVTEAELMLLVANFGSVMKTLILPSKGQAFVQFDSAETASNVVKTYQSIQPSIRGKTVYFQLSNRDHIEISQPKQQNDNPPNTIILVAFHDARFPITLDHIYTTFSQCGEVLKIVTFIRNNQLQAFVQYRELGSAIKARTELDGKDMFIGCCTMRIQYALTTELEVKPTDTRSRDYTKPLPISGLVPSLNAGVNLNSTVNPASLPTFNLNGVPVFPNAMGQPSMAPVNPGGVASSVDESPVVLVSNLNTDAATPEALFKLFGVYGDVIRVKICYNKKEAALIQFTNSQQAGLAIRHLHNVDFYGKKMSVRRSKYREVAAIAKNGDGRTDDGSELTKDFTDSPLHRYRQVNSKNFKHITSPTSVLHVSNLHEHATEQDLRQLFSRFGKINGVQFFKLDRRMALVGFDNEQQAVKALVELHNHKLGGKFLHLSFTSKVINN